ncbi:hypothetical protein TNCT_505331 [Trichonephila clavata]|uniref:Uncharacterized protein n=1 Tax=Trichonephila clavata TaxID=2740835 RepID=A0A8X6KCN5_TRICU|nr:hypothetical protein TNCT_505331 [Trichonephila clavata]
MNNGDRHFEKLYAPLGTPNVRKNLLSIVKRMLSFLLLAAISHLKYCFRYILCGFLLRPPLRRKYSVKGYPLSEELSATCIVDHSALPRGVPSSSQTRGSPIADLPAA